MACGIFTDQGSNQCPLHWQIDFPTIGPPGSLPVTSYLHSEKCFSQVTFSLPHSPITIPLLGKWSVTHIQGQGTIRGEFEGTSIFIMLILRFSFLHCFPPVWNPSLQALEQYKEPGHASHLGVSDSGKARQEQVRAQWVMA